MGKGIIDKDTRRIIELNIINYNIYKRRLKEYEQDIIFCNGSDAHITHYDNEYTKPQSVTEAKALKLNNAYYKCLKHKISAIERAYNQLNSDERKVIENRYWKNSKSKIPYTNIIDVAYSERSMKRIVSKVITLVGYYLGEIQ